MLRRSNPIGKVAVLAMAGLLSLLPQAWAGEHVRGGDKQTAKSQTAVAHTAPRPVSLSVAVTTVPPPARPTTFVDLRGPTGEVRRFALQGGSEVIQTQSVIVLRPGQSVTIRWVARK
jgi:hypothetical protein